MENRSKPRSTPSQDDISTLTQSDIEETTAAETSTAVEDHAGEITYGWGDEPRVRDDTLYDNLVNQLAGATIEDDYAGGMTYEYTRNDTPYDVPGVFDQLDGAMIQHDQESLIGAEGHYLSRPCKSPSHPVVQRKGERGYAGWEWWQTPQGRAFELDGDDPHLEAIVQTVNDILLTYQAVYYRNRGEASTSSRRSSSLFGGGTDHSTGGQLGGLSGANRGQKGRNPENDGEEGDGSPSARSSQDGISMPSLAKFACPFWKDSPLQHTHCTTFSTSEINHLKQHIRRCHTSSISCTKCRLSFANKKQLRHHKRLGRCVAPKEGTHTGLSDDQLRQLKERLSSKLSGEGKWYKIFKIVLPDHDEPKTPYADPFMIHDVCRMLEILDRFRSDFKKNLTSRRAAIHGHGEDEEHILDSTIKESLNRVIRSHLESQTAADFLSPESRKASTEASTRSPESTQPEDSIPPSNHQSGMVDESKAGTYQTAIYPTADVHNPFPELIYCNNQAPAAMPISTPISQGQTTGFQETPFLDWPPTQPLDLDGMNWDDESQSTYIPEGRYR